MASAIYPPTITTSILVNTRTQPKIVYLPAVSTIGAGKLMFIKDICGNAANSSIFLSTAGLDSFDYKFRPSTAYALMSTNFQSVLLASDGLLNWLILQNYNTNSVISGNYVTSNLVYFLDAGNSSSYPGSGSTWTDLMGTGKNMTLYNSPAYSSANGGYLTFVPASSQYAECTTSLTYMSNYSLEVWHYYTTYSGTNPCIVTEIFPGTTSRIAYCLGNASLTMPILQNAFYTGGWQATSGWVPTANAWYQIVGTYDGANLRLYVNNSNIITTANTSVVQSNTAGFRLMRRWDNADYWGGRLGIYRVYNRALTAVEVSQNFNASRSRFGL